MNILEELKGLPMIKAHQILIEFELTDDNIENYRDTYDEQTVLISYFEEEDEDDDSYAIIGGDLCDILYLMRDEMEDREIKDYKLYYCDRWETKNFNGNDIDLLGAAVEAFANPTERNADDMEKSVVCFNDDTWFVMEYNNFQDEITQEDFDKLWIE